MRRGLRLYQARDGAEHAVFPRLADCVTALRVAGSVALAFLPAPSYAFWAVYALCGLSDMLDGRIARMTHTESAFGAKLDSFADLLFVLVCAWRLLPLLRLSRLVWIWACGIALTRLLCLALRRGNTPHTAANRVTGLLLFLFPPHPKAWFALVLCAVATYAALREAYCVAKEKSRQN